jgi:hypothetical protein
MEHERKAIWSLVEPLVAELVERRVSEQVDARNRRAQCAARADARGCDSRARALSSAPRPKLYDVGRVCSRRAR